MKNILLSLLIMMVPSASFAKRSVEVEFEGRVWVFTDRDGSGDFCNWYGRCIDKDRLTDDYLREKEHLNNWSWIFWGTGFGMMLFGAGLSKFDGAMPAAFWITTVSVFWAGAASLNILALTHDANRVVAFFAGKGSDNLELIGDVPLFYRKDLDTKPKKVVPDRESTDDPLENSENDSLMNMPFNPFGMAFLPVDDEGYFMEDFIVGNITFCKGARLSAKTISINGDIYTQNPRYRGRKYSRDGI